MGINFSDLGFVVAVKTVKKAKNYHKRAWTFSFHQIMEVWLIISILEKLPPAFFLAPAENCSRRLQTVGPYKPTFDEIF